MAYKDVEHGYFTDAQSDLNWAQTFRMTNRAPGIANRIFDTLVHMESYINDTSQKASATPGILLVVINDDVNDDNNGVYRVKTVKQLSTDPNGTYEKVGDVVRTFSNMTTDLENFIEPVAFFARIGDTVMPFFINKSGNTTQQFLLTGAGYWHRDITVTTVEGEEVKTVGNWNLSMYATSSGYDSEISNSSENAVQNKVIYTALEDKADTDGSYADLSAGNIVPKSSDIVTDSGASFIFRSSGGDKSISDGTANLKTIGGAISSSWSIPNPVSFKAVGFNAFKELTNFVSGVAFNSSGTVISQSGKYICYVHVLKGVNAEGSNNGYVINRNGSLDETELNIDNVRFSTTIPSGTWVGKTTQSVEYGKHYNSMSYLPPDEGYLLIQTSDIQKLCVHLAWSGYRDTDYEAYSESIVSIPDSMKPHTWGWGKAGSIYDYTNFNNHYISTRVDKVLLGDLTWVAFTEQIDNITDYGYKTTGLSGEIKASTTNFTFCGNLGTKWITVDSSGTLYVHCGTDDTIQPASWSSVTLLYEKATMGSVTFTGELEYTVSDFGTEEFLYSNANKVAPAYLTFNYTPNLVDSLRYLIIKAITTVDTALSTTSENPVQNKVITDALNYKASTSGIYPELVAGNVLAKDTDANTDNASFIFRTSGGNASLTDGDAKLRYVKGNVDSSGVPFSAATFRSVGFNAFNPTNILQGYVLNANGSITADASSTIAIVHVLTSTAGAGYNNGYDISYEEHYSGSCAYIGSNANKVGWMSSVPTGAVSASTVTIVNRISHYNSNSYLMPNFGYMVFNTNGVDLAKICVHLCWSGYRDSDYEEYSHSDITLPITVLHSWGLGKAVDIYDELNINEGTAIKRVERKLISDLTWTERTTVVQELNPEYDPEDPESEEYIDVTYYHYDTDSVTDIANNTLNMTVPGMPNFPWTLAATQSVGTIVVTTKKITISTGTQQVTMATTFAGKYIYYELANYSETAITTSPIYTVSDFGTEEFMDYMSTELACGDAGFYYLPNLLDGVRGLLARDLADAVRNIYVHELTLSQMYIHNATITSVGSKDLTYVSGSDVTVSSSTYGKFVDSDSTEYYIQLTGAVLNKNNLNVYTYDSSVPSVTSVGSYTKANVLPIVATPTFTGNEDASNTLFHLNNGATDTYYRWDAEYFQYIAVTTHIQANKFYIWTTALTTGQVLMVTFDAVEDASLYNEYMLQFPTGATIPTLSFPSTVKWNLAPDLDINVTYQVSVVNNIGLIAGGLE